MSVISSSSLVVTSQIVWFEEYSIDPAVLRFQSPLVLSSVTYQMNPSLFASGFITFSSVQPMGKLQMIRQLKEEENLGNQSLLLSVLGKISHRADISTSLSCPFHLGIVV